MWPIVLTRSSTVSQPRGLARSLTYPQSALSLSSVSRRPPAIRALAAALSRIAGPAHAQLERCIAAATSTLPGLGIEQRAPAAHPPATTLYPGTHAPASKRRCAPGPYYEPTGNVEHSSLPGLGLDAPPELPQVSRRTPGLHVNTLHACQLYSTNPRDQAAMQPTGLGYRSMDQNMMMR